MVGCFLNTLFEGDSALPYEIVIKSSKRALLRHRRDYDTRVIGRQGFIEPKEVGIAPQDRE